jgi:uncharacterized protein
MQQRRPRQFTFSPTDLVTFLGCNHATVLDIQRFSQEIEPDAPSDSDRLIQQKGIDHERGHLQALREQGKQVAEIPFHRTFADRIALTAEALQSGADVIYQAVLYNDLWSGNADFLIKTPTPSALGDFSYEVTDTKLARNPEVPHLIQLCVYSDLLAGVQGIAPKSMHLALGDNRRESYRVQDFVAYVRHTQRRLLAFAGAVPEDSYPEPCAQCPSCRWKTRCEAEWEKDDHLSLVANIQHSQRIKLEAADIHTVADLADLPAKRRIPNLNPQVLERLRHQASLQIYKRRTGQDKVEPLTSEPGRGFYRMPKPDPGDLFFDMEGDPLHPGGLEYLFGLSFEQDGELVFKAFWAHDHDQERESFGKFMEFLHLHLTAHPDAYIYHYNHYEPTALKRLAGSHAVAEHQLDDLLRRQKFVDLYKVVREAIRTSQPGYSLKDLEIFYMPHRRSGAVATAGDSIVVYNQWRDTGDDQLLQQIASYNQTDCESTAGLRDWLLNLRPRDLTWFEVPSRPPDEEAASERQVQRQELEAKYAEYQDRLQAAAGELKEDYRWRLADLLGFHQREERPQWWAYFDRKDRSEDELRDDAECLAGLTLAGPPETVKKSLVHTYRFPAQETKLRAGVGVSDVATLRRAGTIEELDDDKLIVRIKRSTKDGPLPETLTIGPEGPIGTGVLRDALFRVAEDVLAGKGGYPAVLDILNKALPRIRGHRPQESIALGEDLLTETTKAVANLDN